jgi:hypothetical protein
MHGRQVGTQRIEKRYPEHAPPVPKADEYSLLGLNEVAGADDMSE